MALVIVRLKLALLRGALSGGRVGAVVGVVLAFVVALGVGALGGLLFVAARFTRPAVATDIAVAGFTLLFFVWVLGPIITAASDGTLPPERLAPFPLTARQLMPGLLLAGAAGFGGLCTVLVLIGAVVGLAPASPLAVITVVAAIAQLALCVIYSRLLATAVSSVVRRRRGRDVALVLGPVLGLVINIGLQVILRATFDPTDLRGGSDLGPWRSLRPLFAVLPSGPPALAAGLAREGRVAGALVALAATAAFAAVGIKAWHVALEHATTTASASTRERKSEARPLFPWFVRFLPRNRLGAVAARELRLTWRDPRQRAALFGSVFAPVLLMFSLRTLESVDPGIVLLGIAPALFIAIGSANLWGYDGRAAWTDLIAAGDRRDDVVGKVAARALLAAAMSAVAIAGLCWRVGSAARALEAVALGVGAFGLVTGVAIVLAVRNPYPMPDSRTNVFSSGTSGQGFGQAGIALGLLFGSTLVIVPVGAALAYVDSAGLRVLVATAAVATGMATLAAGVRAAAQRLRSHGPEVLADLIPERA